MNTRAIVLSISNPIQSRGYSWIWASAEGKTVITLTAVRDLMLDSCEVSKTLVIAPLRVARDTWPAEAEKWDHLENIDASVIVGDRKARIAALNHSAMVYVVNRETVKWLVEYYEKNGLKWDFDAVVIDELSSFKNHQSQLHISVKQHGRPGRTACHSAFNGVGR